MSKFTTFLRGLLAGFLMCFNTALICLPLFLVALLKLLIPLPGWRTACNHLLDGLSACWISVNRLWVRAPERVIGDDLPLSEVRWCLVTCNHQSWADIFLAQRLLNRRLPQMKFFLKQELIWVPVVGLCWWALDYPFMKRYSREQLKKNPKKLGKDLETARNACRKFSDRPVAIFNFMEGTRFTTEKHRRQRSPFQHLLKPKVGGTGLALDVMGAQVDTLVDLTIHYRGEVPGFWDFLCGRYGEVTIQIALKEIPEELRGRDYNSDSDFRHRLQRWIQQLWEDKDRVLGELDTAAARSQARPAD